MQESNAKVEKSASSVYAGISASDELEDKSHIATTKYSNITDELTSNDGLDESCKSFISTGKEVSKASRRSISRLIMMFRVAAIVVSFALLVRIVRGVC